MRPPWINDYDGQMMSGDRLGLKFPDICLMGEEKPQKNLTQETCPDRESNPGPLRERRIRYPLLHNARMSNACIQKEIKHRLNSGNACYCGLQRLLSSQLLSKNIKLKKYKTVILPEKRLQVFENKQNDLYGKSDIRVRRILEGKLEEKRPWKNNINQNLREDRDVCRAYARTAINVRVR
ncbi:hypothetical protein C0J52_25540 [Blattella germanica]|nr:hypothetical protein C0J52_25540 [Blattella germanica]